MSPRTRLYLVRHGLTTESVRGRCIGRTDAPLSAAGLASAEQLAGAFGRIPVATVYSSRLQRASATAAPIAARAGCELGLIDGLAEIDFGALEGRAFDEIASAEPDLYTRWMTAPALVRFPGGESYADLKARAIGSIIHVPDRNQGAVVVAVSHGGPIRAILAGILGLPDHAAFSLAVDHASVTLVEWRGQRPTLRGLNLPARTALP